MTAPRLKTRNPQLTPAEHGLIAAVLDDCARDGFGDDGTVDALRDALIMDGTKEDAAEAIAYAIVHC